MIRIATLLLLLASATPSMALTAEQRAKLAAWDFIIREGGATCTAWEVARADALIASGQSSYRDGAGYLEFGILATNTYLYNKLPKSTLSSDVKGAVPSYREDAKLFAEAMSKGLAIDDPSLDHLHGENGGFSGCQQQLDAIGERVRWAHENGIKLK